MRLRHSVSGFTMIELITIMVLLGILTVMAVPRMNSTSTFRALEFHDKTIAALRYAQKTATSHRRLVCVAFASNSVTLTIDHDDNGACNGQALLVPGSSSNIVQSTDSTGVFASTPATLYFQPDGRGTSDAAGANPAVLDTTIDSSRLYVAGATGFIGNAP